MRFIIIVDNLSALMNLLNTKCINLLYYSYFVLILQLERANEEQRNRELGNPGDVDFQRMIRQYRLGKDAPVEQVLPAST